MNHCCRICGNDDQNQTYEVREMLHGTREQFTYFQCRQCGCLQIDPVPTDLERHYPATYQAYKDYHRRARNKLRRAIDTQRVHYLLTGHGLYGKLLAHLLPPLDYIHWLKTMGIGPSSRILDVGCGNGKLLARMLAGGFTNLYGIDPFIKGDIDFGPHARIHNTDLPGHLARNPDKYDLVMLHHSFEHMDNPRDVLGWCRELMHDKGWLLIRIPLADSLAWDEYRENWFALDPPRHLYLHTSRSIHLITRECGLKVCAEERDSQASQFIQSEWYVRDIPANAPRERKPSLSPSQIQNFEKLAQKVNAEGRGDQGVFYIQKSS